MRSTSGNLAGSTRSPATAIMVRAWCSVHRWPFARPRRHTNPVPVPAPSCCGRRRLVGERRRDLRRVVGVSPDRRRCRAQCQRGADDGDIVQAVRAGADAVVRLGGAHLGDKTMVDALIPFADTASSSFAAGNPLAQAWLQADSSLGHADPGATSFALLLGSVAELLDKKP